jgi:thiamine biosynthesis lipoprotein
MMKTRAMQSFSTRNPLTIPAIAVIVAWLLAGCTHHRPSPPPLQRHEFSQVSMGVQVRLVVYAKDESSARSACKAAYDRVNALDAIMSDYQRDSELMRLCAGAGKGPVKVGDDLLRVLDYAQEVSRRSDGAFDVTVGPLVALWRQARKTRVLPSLEQLAEVKSRVGWRLMKLNRARQTVELLKPGMKLDLGGIAKGYAGDEAIRVLHEQGIEIALFEAGGDIVVSGAPPSTRGWNIELPTGRKITLANQAVSTSGDTAQYVEINGRRYSHVVDPQTGLGLSEHFIATVIARRGMTTDAVSTAATILGPERGERLCKSFKASGWLGKSS